MVYVFTVFGVKNMRIKAFLVSAVFALSALINITSFAEELPYVETLFNERSGLPTGEANDVLQTGDGYVWVGSYGGLIRYDGTEFRNYSTEGLLPSSSVRALFEDSDGRLWIGTNDAGVFRYENGIITKPEGQPSDSFLCIRGFAEDKNGVVYACSTSGIAEIENDIMRVYDTKELSGLTIYSIGADKYGRVWGADSAGGCIVLDRGNFVKTVSAGELFKNGETVYSVTADRDGNIWVGSSDTALVKLDFPAGDPDAPEMTAFDTGSVSTHNSLRAMDDGSIVVSGLHGAAVVYADGTIKEFSEEEGAESVNSAYIDYEGNIWLASSSEGIVRFSVGCYSSPNRAAGLSGVTLNAIAISDGISYMGLDGGLIVCDNNWERIENELTAKLSGVRIRHIIADSKGRVWIASYSDFPVICYDAENGEITSFSSKDGLSGDKARSLLEMSDGSIAVGTQKGVSIIKDGKVTRSYTDLDYPAILCLLETKDGSLLAGSDGGGIYEINGDTVTSHGFSEGLSEGVVLRILADKDGYFISAGSSLYYWKDGAFTKLSALKKEAGSIFDLYPDADDDDTLWLLQNNGILRTDKSELLSGGDGSPVTYGFSYGLSGSLNANTWHCLYDGRLYLATRSGVSVFGFTAPKNELPKAKINSVTVDGTVYETGFDTLKIPGDTQRVTVNFAALTYTDTTLFETAYILEGFDDGEITLSGKKSGSVSYTNLPGGTYTFKLRIYTPDDPSGGNTIGFELTKDKKLTEQPLFWVGMLALVVVAAVGIVLLIYSAKLRAARRRQKEYRDIVEQSLLTFAGTIDAKDKYTNGHSTRVALYSREIARRMGLSEEQQERIYYVGLLHDIGKIGIPDSILNKPTKLTPEEREIIQKHPAIGAEILKNFTAIEGIADGAKFHHERWDGNGYCEGRKGEEIPLLARIIGVADTYDAMSSQRTYNKLGSKEHIEDELEKGKGTQFDPSIVKYMISMIEDGFAPIKQDKFPDTFITHREDNGATQETE